jgi:putative redox protein
MRAKIRGSRKEQDMAHAKAVVGLARYRTTIDAAGHRIVADEPQANGGANEGMAPYDLLLASLGACTAITLRMYADRKQWDLQSLTVDLQYLRNDKEERIKRKLHMTGKLDDEQRARIADIAERTPVTLTLKKGLTITTELVPLTATEARNEELSERLDEALDESFPASDPPAVTP